MEEEIIKINMKCQSKINSLYEFLLENLKDKFLFSLNNMYFLDGKMFFKVTINHNLINFPITGVYIMIDTTHIHHYSTPIIIYTRIYKNYLFTNNKDLGYVDNNYRKFSSNKEVLDELLNIYNYILKN